MPTAESAQVQLELGQSLVSWEALTDSGDATVFNPSEAILSGASGKTPTIRPNGIVTGGTITPTTTAEQVAVAAITCYLAGVETSVGAGNVTVTRPSTSDYKISSITVTSAGALAEVEGTEGSSFSETRDAAGGPPLIPVGSIEVGQVRMSSQASAVIAAAEVFQVIGQHLEKYDYPAFSFNPIGEGLSAASAGKVNAFVEFASALPLIHTGSVPKAVYAQYYAPIFSALQKAHSFVPAETTHSVSTTQYYGGEEASRSSQLGQGSFTALLEDGITDAIVAAKNDVRTVKFYSDRNRTPYVLTQGTLGISRSFGQSDPIAAAVTISAVKRSAEFAS